MPSYGRAYNIGRIGTVVEWLKREGEAFSAGEPLVIVESDKVTLEVRAPEDGTLVQIVAPVGFRLTAHQKLGLFAPAGEAEPASEISTRSSAEVAGKSAEDSET